MLWKTIEPFGQVWNGIANPSVKDSLEASDEAGADVDVGQADFVVYNPLHIIRYFLMLEVLV